MRRKATKNTRLANKEEKAFMAWIKMRPCCICGKSGPSIVDHMYGSCFKHNKVLIGHWALLPYCEEHDKVKTIYGRKAHDKEFGRGQYMFWRDEHTDYMFETGIEAPYEVFHAITEWGR